MQPTEKINFVKEWENPLRICPYIGFYEGNQEEFGKSIYLNRLDFEKFKIIGNGCDEEGEFVIDGVYSYNPNEFQLIIKNSQEEYIYKGEYIGEFKELKGECIKPGFQGNTILIKKFTKFEVFNGYYIFEDSKYDMKIALGFGEDKTVEGKGYDEIGLSLWKGKMIDKSNVKLIKHYVGKHNVNYNGGFYEDNRMIIFKGQYDVGHVDDFYCENIICED